MSAFLKFSQKTRPQVKKSNPNMTNTDVSRLLGEMWRTASPPEKQPFVDQEVVERAKYNDEQKTFRHGQAKTDAASRTRHRDVHQVAAAEKSRSKEKDTPRGHNHARVGIYHDPYMLVGGPPYSSTPANTNGFTYSDRRIFRPFSGGQPYESGRFYKDEQHMIYPSYEHNEVIPAPPPPPIKVDRPTFRSPKPSAGENRQYGAGSESSRVAGAAIHRYRHQTTPSLPFRPSFHPSDNPNVAQLRYTNSDISQFEGFNIDGNLSESFVDPDPPFNPRQQRPSSSHYFSESFSKYS